jgi:hypothetical protein
VRTHLVAILLLASCDTLDTGSYPGELLANIDFHLSDDDRATLNRNDQIDSLLLVWDDGQRETIGGISIFQNNISGLVYQLPIPTADVLLGRFQLVESRFDTVETPVPGRRFTSRSYMQFTRDEMTLFVDHPDPTIRACTDIATAQLSTCTTDCAAVQQQLDDCPYALIELSSFDPDDPSATPIGQMWPTTFDDLDDLTRDALPNRDDNGA